MVTDLFNLRGRPYVYQPTFFRLAVRIHPVDVVEEYVLAPVRDTVNDDFSTFYVIAW